MSETIHILDHSLAHHAIRTLRDRDASPEQFRGAILRLTTLLTAEVTRQGRHDKVKIIKFNRRKHHRKQQGHRQWFTEVKITGIKA